MKLLAIFAMFAFVAVQLSCSAPVPDEEKKAEPEVAPAAAPVEASSHAVPEAKSDQSEPVAKLAEPAASPVQADEKKA